MLITILACAKPTVKVILLCKKNSKKPLYRPSRVYAILIVTCRREVANWEEVPLDRSLATIPSSWQTSMIYFLNL
jgi:hypothetical protein